MENFSVLKKQFYETNCHSEEVEDAESRRIGFSTKNDIPDLADSEEMKSFSESDEESIGKNVYLFEAKVNKF